MSRVEAVRAAAERHGISVATHSPKPNVGESTYTFSRGEHVCFVARGIREAEAFVGGLRAATGSAP